MEILDLVAFFCKKTLKCYFRLLRKLLIALNPSTSCYALSLP